MAYDEITITNSEIKNGDIIIYNGVPSVTIIDSYFENNIEIVIETTNCLIQNCQFNELGHISISNYGGPFHTNIVDSQFNIRNLQDTYSEVIEIEVNSPTTVNNVLFNNATFFNLTSPVFGFDGNFTVTFNNCDFENITETSDDSNDYWIGSCPSGLISFTGNQTSYPADSPLIDYGITCGVTCDSYTTAICHAVNNNNQTDTGNDTGNGTGDDNNGDSPNYLWIIVVVVIVVFGGFICAGAIYLFIKSRKQRDSFSPIGDSDY